MLKFCLTKLRYYCCNSQVLLLPKTRQCKLFGWISTLHSFGPIPRHPSGGRTFRLFEYHCNGRETRIEYCTQTTAVCSQSTVDSSSIGVICGNLVDEGQGDVVSYTCMGHYTVCIPGHSPSNSLYQIRFCTVDSIGKNRWQASLIWRDSPTLSSRLWQLEAMSHSLEHLAPKWIVLYILTTFDQIAHIF